MKTIKQLLTEANSKLRKNSIKTARLDAEVILSFVLNRPKEYLYTYPEGIVSKDTINRFLTLIKKRSSHYPIAYLTNNKEFFGLDFYVDENVLVPRPETESLVEETLKEVKTRLIASPHSEINIAEIGTGSGCIAVALAKEVETRLIASPPIKIMATDISAAALKIARRNARKHKVLSRIKFYQGNLLEPLKNKKIDLIVANLPYLDSDYKNLLNSSDKKALKFEPSLALYSGKEGLNHYAEFFEQVAELKHKPKFILVEFGPKQTSALKKIIHQNLGPAKLTKVQPGTLMIELT